LVKTLSQESWSALCAVQRRILTGDVVAISSCTGTSSINVGSHGMKLSAVLVSDDGASSSSCVGSEYNSALKRQSVRWVSLQLRTNLHWTQLRRWWFLS